jgi:hypothetical protein
MEVIMIKRSVFNESGQGMFEYIMVLAIVAVGGAAVLFKMSKTVKLKMAETAADVLGATEAEKSQIQAEKSSLLKSILDQ